MRDATDTPLAGFRATAWPIILTAGVTIGSLAYACIFPFVAFAVVCAATMSARAALRTVGAVWLLNQAIGYGVLGYPHTADSFGWGLAIVVAALAATVVAIAIVGQRGLVATRLVAAGVAGFAAYEGLLFAYAHVAGGLETFSSDIVGLIARGDALWLVGLVGVRMALTTTMPALFGGRQTLRFA